MKSTLSTMAFNPLRLPPHPLPLPIHRSEASLVYLQFLEHSELFSTPFPHVAASAWKTLPVAHYTTDCSQVYPFFERRGHFHHPKGSCGLGNLCTPGTWHICAVTIRVVVE